MGMAASQVRFLSLQHRKNSIGRQLSTLSNRKMSLSRDMNDVSRHYTEALNKINLKWSNDCGNTYHGLSYDMLMKPNDVNCETPYILTNARNGKVILNDSALFDQDGNKMMTGEWGNVGGQTLPAGELSYLRFAKMISSFTGISDDGSEIYCNKNDGFKQDEDGNWVGQANPGAYYIPSNHDFSFENNLRMKIFMLMGLVTQDQIDTQNSLLTELYGSQEAKDTGIYPVGTAWGDYYIALANLEAYDAYLGSKQTLSNAGTYEGTAKTEKTYEDTIQDYTYSTVVKGITGDSTCTQESSNTGAAAHINFNAGVIKDETTGLYNCYKDGEAGFDSDAMKALFDDEKYDATIESADPTWGATFTHTLTQNSGLKYEYHYNDVLANAFENYKANGGSVEIANTPGYDGEMHTAYGETFNIEEALFADDDEISKRSYVLSHRKRNSYNKTYGAIEEGINSLCNKFAEILRSNTLVEIDEDAVTKATNAVVQLYMANKDQAKADCPRKSDDEAMAASINKVGVSIRKKGWHIHNWQSHTRRVAAAVDVKTLFNTFLSYYTHYARANDQGTDGSTIERENIPEIVVATESTAATENETCRLVTVGGKKFLETTCILGQDANGRNIISKDRVLLTTSSGDAEDSEEYCQFDGSDNLLEEESSIAIKYYVARDQSQNYSIEYYENTQSNGNTYSYTDDDGNPVRNPVFATISTEDRLYYCTTQAELQAFIGSNTLPANSIEYVETLPTEFPIQMLIGDKNKNSEDYIAVDSTLAASNFDIRFNTKINPDPAYRKHLVDAVNAAQQRVKELEADIEDFFSNSDKKIMDYYDAIFLRISEQGWEQDEHTANATYLNNKIQNNDIFLTECLQKNSSTGYRYTAKQATNISKIFSVHDTNAEQEALVKYESEKNMIQYKENVIDTRMRILETEQEAINTEMESVQKVCNDNISKYFKIFA